jgi:hypothetical protein
MPFYGSASPESSIWHRNCCAIRAENAAVIAGGAGRGECMSQFIEQTEDPLVPIRSATLNRVRILSFLLDEYFRIPGTKYRIGLDGLLGLLPGIGDTVGMLLSAYILFEATRLGVPRATRLRMAANITLDTLVGVIPLLGDVFDVAWKANKKNVALLNAYLASQRMS